MNLRDIISEFKWIALVFVISFLLVTFLNSNALFLIENSSSQNTFFGLNSFLENVVFFIFSTFVVYGIKGFFETYSQKIPNLIMIVSGGLLALAVIILSYQILFEI